MVGNGGGLGGFMRRSTTSTASGGAAGKDKDKMDLPKLQTRSTSTFPPPHKTQLPMRYQTQHYQNAGSSARSPALICKRSAWVVFMLLSFFFVSLYLISLARGVQFSSQVSSANRKRYGVVIDAGSSGSRIHIFQYKHGVIPAVDLIGLEQLSLKRTPGLSSFADNPSLAGDSLMEQLEFAKTKVPEKERSRTRVYLMATAGLRRLDKTIQEAVLDSCRKVLRASSFQFRDEWASVISGTDEGVYAWVSANYALGTLQGDPTQTTGIVELGGASAQVTFAPKEPPPPAYRHNLELGGRSYMLYTYSFLNFGQEAAWDSLLELITAGGALATPRPGLKKDIAIDPCTPRGYKRSIEENARHSATVSTATHTPVSTVISRGNFSECREAAYSLLQHGHDACAYPKCAIGNAFIPDIQGRFFATENFFYTSEFFKLPATTSLAEIADAGEHYCGEDWTRLQEKHKSAEEKDLLKYCFSTAYIVALMHDSLGIGMQDDRVKFTNKVHNVPLDWALGALIVKLSEDEEQIPHPWLFSAGYVKVLSLLVLMSVGLVVIWFIARWRRPQVTTIYDLEKGRYITTASRIR
ncbi:hypothetical protein M758_7G152800 [Ceratodon purpureus]|nr:hypothetical protein M758_7G152800 [Ceratodon purpureus]